jgi:hypothetical protein
MAVRYAPEPAALSDAQNDLNTLGLDEALSETLVVDEPVRFSARISCDTLPGTARASSSPKSQRLTCGDRQCGDEKSDLGTARMPGFYVPD